MARYKLTLSYDGSDFSGSQRQARHRTVQGELENALRPLGWRQSAIMMAGRTDAGVHASGQVAAADLDWRHAPTALRDALNARLPRDMAVTAAEIAGDAFHPRYDAIARRYRYRVRCQSIRDPLCRRTAWITWPEPDAEILNWLAERLVGRHDFGAFGSATSRGGGTIRNVAMAEWTVVDDDWCFEIAADGFLYRLVRRLVYVQVSAAQHRCSRETVVKALEAGHPVPDLVAGLAPPQGLALIGVEY